ncbi:hypothetical protein Y032_0236g3223 [Ancylostoma ceylanicum]|uniref:Uncharacterized protein n=1 Tax=Ancylostoma ceylanicum TaxID=53326 RepID=A0A016SFF1_9BILA|nr:hypothetical protein Y032_0236g3223 [Ancylostoma ceylanicum]
MDNKRPFTCERDDSRTGSHDLACLTEPVVISRSNAARCGDLHHRAGAEKVRVSHPYRTCPAVEATVFDSSREMRIERRDQRGSRDTLIPLLSGMVILFNMFKLVKHVSLKLTGLAVTIWNFYCGLRKVDY